MHLFTLLEENKKERKECARGNAAVATSAANARDTQVWC